MQYCNFLITKVLLVQMNYKIYLPTQSERSKHLTTVMANRRQIQHVLPKMITVLLVELEDLEHTQQIVYAKSFLAVFDHFARTLTSDVELSQNHIQVLGFISDLYIRSKWNPNKKLPFETPSEIMTWFCVFLLAHFSESDLSWHSKIGLEVLEQFKKMPLDPTPLKPDVPVQKTGCKKVEQHEYSPACT